MKVLVLGAGGIIGQWMRETQPASVTATYTRLGISDGYYSVDLTDFDAMEALITAKRPNVVVNLAGESNTDVVERDPKAHEAINVRVPGALARLSDLLGYRLIHTSTQAVFSGQNPRYGLNAALDPINEYGRQKAEAETIVLAHPRTMVVRPTFVLGVRPDPTIGRQNPIEAMLSGQRKQVDDRYFSVSFAPDVANLLWAVALAPDHRRVIQAGIPGTVTRWQIAHDLGLRPERASHADFPGIAPRPFDTSYAAGDHIMTYEEGLAFCQRQWHARDRVAA